MYNGYSSSNPFVQLSLALPRSAMRHGGAKPHGGLPTLMQVEWTIVLFVISTR